MSAHTPEPWTYDNSGKYYGPAVIRHNGVVIARIPAPAVGCTAAETAANAALMAQAPALLAALKNLLAGPNWPGAQMTARAAIAAAEGRTL